MEDALGIHRAVGSRRQLGKVLPHRPQRPNAAVGSSRCPEISILIVGTTSYEPCIPYSSLANIPSDFPHFVGQMRTSTCANNPCHARCAQFRQTRLLRRMRNNDLLESSPEIHTVIREPPLACSCRCCLSAVALNGRHHREYAPWSERASRKSG